MNAVPAVRATAFHHLHASWMLTSGELRETKTIDLTCFRMLRRTHELHDSVDALHYLLVFNPSILASVVSIMYHRLLASSDLDCIVLYCIGLHCSVLHCIVSLYCIVLNRIALYCIGLHCIALYCVIVLYCIALNCIVLYCIGVHCIVLY